jgi:hypothetical protein
MLKSIIIAAAIGAVLLWAWEHVSTPCTACDATEGLLPGAVVGAGVQFILRMTEVS